jgi:hypothetical protein
VQRLLWVLTVGLGRQAVFDPPSQHHHAPRAAPARQPQLAFDGVEALAHAVPLPVLPLPFDQALNPGGLAQLEQIALPHGVSSQIISPLNSQAFSRCAWPDFPR